MAAIVLAAALLPGCGVFSHKLARPIVHHAQGQWTHENTAIYGSVSSFRVRHEACNAVSAPVWRLLTSGPRGVRLPAGEPKPITTRHHAPSGDAAPPHLAFAV